jgi:diadenosine tetraphosphate (Ap4A) HIT family hydrolase
VVPSVWDAFTDGHESALAAPRRRERRLIHDESCLACRIARGEHVPPGGVLLREGGFALHAVADATPLRGWLVLTSERHAHALDHLDPSALAALGPLAARVVAAQRAALGAEHVYAFSIGDAVRHFHLHLVPRFPDTPERLRGRRCFEGRAEEMLPEAEVVRAARLVAAALAGS